MKNLILPQLNKIGIKREL